MMLCEVLGQLEAGEVVVGGNAPHHPRRLKVRKVPIGGTSGEVGKPLRDIVDAHGVAGAHQHVDDGAPSVGIALIATAKSAFDNGM